jgi:hypothetical protein
MSTDPGPSLMVRAGAALSNDGRYRYQLWRYWSDAPPMGFVMLNPSTADASLDDATIRRCSGFARREGCGGIVVANLSPLRATDPADLDFEILRWPDGRSATVTGHCQFVAEAMQPADIVVMAWGALSSRSPRARRFLSDQVEGIAARLFMERPDRDLLCFEKTKDGSPKHPLYLPGDARLALWRRPDRAYGRKL